MAAREKLHRHHLRLRWAFRERKDVLNELDDRELVKRYRLDRAGITFVTDLVRERLKRPTVRNKALSPEMQVIITLRYLATGKMQQCSADDLGPSQQTISRVISDTLEALSDNAILSLFIRFPVTQLETQRRKEEFLQIAGFPEVIGAIDGTHVRIVAPSEYEAEFVNRKRYHSINVQFVFDARYHIIDVVAKWPGSVHDARILAQSGLCTIFENGIVPAGCHLLGDSGYPSKKWLLTPYLRPQPGAQSSYNR
ncbi:putative nuclease HARBI1 [Portunus trituberculatus]|uniref:putative nuclease HARBI1 n=1 Tax=Portunus trituberculatus TaxID=210409 RepID=UPI001E1CE6BF|nr:putative nuclease HARBI1 [Portunus trituberculatus]